MTVTERMLFARLESLPRLFKPWPTSKNIGSLNQARDWSSEQSMLARSLGSVILCNVYPDRRFFQVNMTLSHAIIFYDNSQELLI